MDDDPVMGHALSARDVPLHLITEHMLDIIAETDDDLMPTYISPSVKDVLGYEPRDLIGTPLLNKVHPDDAPSVIAETRRYYETAKAGGPTISRQEFRLRHADGHYLWIEAHSHFVFRADNHFATAVTVARDISTRKQIEAQLRASEEQYRSVFETARDSLFVIDQATGAILDANPAACQLYGYTRAELVTMKNTDVSAEPDRTAAALQTGLTHAPVRYHRKKDGTAFPVEITASYFAQGDRRLSTVAVRDITERLRAENALEQRNRELALLNRAAQAFASTLDLNSVLTAVLEEVRGLFAASASSIWLIDRATDEVVCHAATGPHADVVRGWRLTQDQGFVGWAARRDQSLIVADARTDDRYFPGVDRRTGFTLRSIISVPLRVQRNVIGVIQVVDEQPDRFDADALRLIELLANAAAIATENARLFEETRQRADRLAAIAEISTAINLPLDMASIMQTAVDGLTRVLSVEQIGLALFDETHRHLTVVAESVAPGGSSAMGVQLPIVDNLSMDRILATKAPLSIVDAQNDPLLANVRDVMIQRCIQSILLVPLVVRGEIIGTLGCDAVTAPHRFMPDEIELAQIVANLLAARLEQARLFEAECQQRVLAEALRDTAAALNSTLDFDEVLDLILANVERVTRHDAADVILLDSAHDRAQLARYRSMIDSNHAAEVATIHFTLSQTRNLREMLATGEPVIVADTHTYDGWITTPLTNWIRSNVGVPIKIKGETIGFLSLDSAVPNAFTAADADRLRIFADQAATAIYNARLYEQVQRHAADLEAKVADRTRELQRERNRLQAVFDSAGEGIQIVDLNYTIQYCNPATTRITGYASDEIVGRSIQMWRTGPAAPTVVDELRRRVQRGEPWQGELISRRKDGTPYDVAVTINPLTDADGQLIGYVSVQRDITRLKELDRLKDQFVSRIGHELRTPLSNLIIYLNLLEHGKADKRGDYLQTLRREADRLRRLIEGFLKIADLDANTVLIDLAPTDLNQLVMDLVAKQWPIAAEHGLVLEPLLDPALPPIRTDAELISEVLTRLLDNAFNYTPRAGHISLSTAQGRQDDQGSIVVTVRDTGPGVPPEELTRVFDRFYRGTATRNYTFPGVGLSLAICKEIVAKLGGRITVDSEPGRGAAFTVWLKP